MSTHAYTTRKPGRYQAQHGEDLWLETYFGGQKGFFVEVGAYDGVILSNTYALETLGWSGILIEPDAEKAKLCRENRPKAQCFECAAVGSADIEHVTFHVVPDGGVYSTSSLTAEHAKRIAEYGLTRKEVTVRARTLDSILAEVALPSVDFVSIDVEGAEIDVLRGFDLARWRPRVVMVEVATPYRSPAVRNELTRNGYVFLTSISVNDIYVPVASVRGVVEAVDRVRYVLSKSAQFVSDVARAGTRRILKRP